MDYTLETHLETSLRNLHANPDPADIPAIAYDVVALAAQCGTPPIPKDWTAWGMAMSEAVATYFDRIDPGKLIKAIFAAMCQKDKGWFMGVRHTGEERQLHLLMLLREYVMVGRWLGRFNWSKETPSGDCPRWLQSLMMQAAIWPDSGASIVLDSISEDYEMSRYDEVCRLLWRRG